jgi:hypothetical protein
MQAVAGVSTSTGFAYRMQAPATVENGPAKPNPSEEVKESASGQAAENESRESAGGVGIMIDVRA